LRVVIYFHWLGTPFVKAIAAILPRTGNPEMAAGLYVEIVRLEPATTEPLKGPPSVVE